MGTLTKVHTYKGSHASQWRFIGFVAGAVACAPHHPTPATVLAASTERLKETYACVVDAISEAGYVVTTNERELGVSGKLISQTTPMGAGAQDLQPGLGEKVRHPGDVGTGYSIDQASAGVKVDPVSGRIVVVAGASSGISETGRGGYYQKGPTARGLSAVTHARACAETASVSN